MTRRRTGLGVLICVAALAAYGCGTLIGADEERTLAMSEAGVSPGTTDGSSTNDAGTEDGAVKLDCPDPITFYRDGDRDGYGKDPKLACDQAQAGPDYITVGGDCDDGDKNVHPGQLAYFPNGYTLPNDGGISFDYNCDGQESEKAGVDHWNGCDASACTGGDGYPPVARVGAKNLYCGSAERARCKLEPGDPVCQTDRDPEIPNPCR